MWTPTTRAQHSRAGLRYGSDLTDSEWALLAPFLPPKSDCGRHRKWPMREIVNAISFVLRGGCAWSMLPKCFPPWPTVYRWFARFAESLSSVSASESFREWPPRRHLWWQ
jgi:putative transposase